MLKLIAETLRYHRKAIALAWGIALAAGIVFVVVALVEGVRDEPLGLWMAGIVVATGGLIASMVVCFVIAGVEDKEHRLVLLIALPVSRRQVGLARAGVLTALMLLALVAATLISAACSLMAGAPLPPTYVPKLLFIAGQLHFLAQIPLAAREIGERRQSHRPREALRIFLVLALLCAAIAWVELGRLSGFPARILLAWPLGLLLAAFNVALFDKRTSLVR